MNFKSLLIATAASSVLLTTGCGDETSINNPPAPITHEFIQSIASPQFDQDVMAAGASCPKGDRECFGQKMAILTDKLFDDAGYSMDKTIREVYLLRTNNPQNNLAIYQMGFDNLFLGALVPLGSKSGKEFLLNNKLISQETIDTIAAAQ